MIDFHTHVLFGMDDGAINLEESLEMVRMQKAQGVTTIVVTPHFDVSKQDLAKFIHTRDENIKILKQAISDCGWNDIRILSGAELLYSTDLHDIDLSQLVIESTDYILVEFSTVSITQNLENRMENFINQGFVPILAHIERYPFFLEKPKLIKDVIELGCYTQVNGSTIIEGKQSNFIKACFKHNLIHFIASDCHSIDRRIPNVGKTLKVVAKQYGEQIVDDLINNSKEMINSKEIRVKAPSSPKSILGKFF